MTFKEKNEKQKILAASLIKGAPLWATIYAESYVESKKVNLISYNKKNQTVKVEEVKKSWVSKSHGSALINRWFHVNIMHVEKREVKFINSDESPTFIDMTLEDFCY